MAYTLIKQDLRALLHIAVIVYLYIVTLLRGKLKYKEGPAKFSWHTSRCARFKKFLRIMFFAFFPILSAVVFVLVSYLHLDGWSIELLSFAVPLLMVASLVGLLIYILTRPRKIYLLFILPAVLLGLKPAHKTIGMNFKAGEEAVDFTVMSFNVAAFNPNRMSTFQSDTAAYTAFYKWLRENGSPDILCLQEFYHGQDDELDNTLDSIAFIGQYTYYYINPRYNLHTNGMLGVITFSKYRSVASGSVVYGDTLVNKGIFNHFLIEGDTVRVINFQFKSMSIRISEDDSAGAVVNAGNNLRNIYTRLHNGYRQRNRELEVIDKVLQSKPYKTILCADINALPYSTTYRKLNENYCNAFEEAGEGFGFTYNRFPRLIRIDNQFYDKRLGIGYFKTHDEIQISDHYPIEAGYLLGD